MHRGKDLKKSEIFWWVVIVGIAVTMAYGVYYHQKLVKGFCPAEGRYLGEQELIDISVNAALLDRERRFLDRPAVFEKAAKYNSLEDYYDRNSGCCQIALANKNHVLADEKRIAYNRRTYGGAFFIVELSDPAVQIFRDEFLMVSACGQTSPASKWKGNRRAYPMKQVLFYDKHL